MAIPTLSSPANDPSASPDLDEVVSWILDGVQWGASLFHVGRYCGRWRASTAGASRASFHLVLEGRCWLHIPGQPSTALGPRDGVFLMRDVPHFISPYADSRIDCAKQAMQPISSEVTVVGETALACGFFSLDGPLQELVVSAFPAHLVLRGDSQGQAASGLFDLMLDEGRRAGLNGSAVMDRLVGLLFFFGLRHAAQADDYKRGLWQLLRRPGFAPLVSGMLRTPGHAWTVAEMAGHAQMSRAAFFRHFTEACGQSPLQFLLLLRMQMAARQLRRGQPIGAVAEAVGYEAAPSFSRAFKRVMGQQPGAWQRARLCDG